MGSERSGTVFSANVKLDRFLVREKALLQNSANSVKQEISCQQRLAYAQFRKKYLKSEQNHAQLYLDKSERREIDRVVELERHDPNNAYVYRRMLANRVATAPSVIARTLLTPATAKSRAVSRKTERADRRRKPNTPSGNKQVVNSTPNVDSNVLPNIDHGQFPEADEDRKTEKVFLTETDMIKETEPKDADQTRYSATKKQNQRPNTTAAIGRSNKVSYHSNRKIGQKRDSVDEIANDLKSYQLKEAVTFIRYPGHGDAYSRVNKRMNKYICRPQEISNKEIIDGVVRIRESEVLKLHREKTARANYNEPIANLVTDVESNLKATNSRDFIGEETIRRVRARKLNEVQPTPESVVERHCGVYARIPRSHTFSNWVLDD